MCTCKKNPNALLVTLFSFSLSFLSLKITQCEIFLSMLVKFLDSDKPLWQRTLAVEVLHAFCNQPSLLRSVNAHKQCTRIKDLIDHTALALMCTSDVKKSIKLCCVPSSNTHTHAYAHTHTHTHTHTCLLYTSPSPRDATLSRMPSSA